MPDCTVSNTKFSSVTLNELAIEAVIITFNKAVNEKTAINPNRVQIRKHCLENMGLNILNFLTSLNISADLKGPKEKKIYKLHYGRCTGLLFRAATQHNTSCSDNK